MYRFIILVLVLTVVTAEQDESKKKCHKLRHPGIMQCCKSFDLSRLVMVPEDLKECTEIPFNPKSCEHHICIGKKKGFVSEDGTIDKETFEKIFEEDFKALPAFVEAVKNTCFKGKVADLDGPPEMCELMKIEGCIHRQAIQDCKEWDDSGPCAGIQDLVKECATSDS